MHQARARAHTPGMSRRWLSIGLTWTVLTLCQGRRAMTPTLQPTARHHRAAQMHQARARAHTPGITLHELDADRALSWCSTDAPGTRARAHTPGMSRRCASSPCSTDAAGTRALDAADAADQDVFAYMEEPFGQSTGTSCAHARTRARCARTRGAEHRTLFRSERRRLQRSSDCRVGFRSERLRRQRSSECRVFPAPRSA